MRSRTAASLKPNFPRIKLIPLTRLEKLRHTASSAPSSIAMSHELSIDLNCDLGTGSPHEAALMPWISSANIACGGHAGDEATMRRSVELALRHGVSIGAQPGFEDRENFGRIDHKLSESEVFDLVTRQVLALRRIVMEQGGSLTHVKPHGELYHQANQDPAIAHAISNAVLEIDRELIVFGQYDSTLTSIADAIGLIAIGEAFADRTYQADGSPTPRTQANTLITDVSVACAQALQIARHGRVRATDGSEIFLKARTIHIPDDDEHAIDFARALRTALLDGGIHIEAPHYEEHNH